MKHSNFKFLKNKIIVGVSLLILILLLIIFPCIMSLFKVPINNDNENNNQEFSEDSIIITNDSDFSKYSIEGNGSSIDPYIIGNYIIKNKEETSISIFNTSKYFVIKNCTIEGNKVGIAIKNVKNGTASIINNNFTSNSVDIKIDNSSNITILNNEIEKSKENSIIIQRSESIIIENNYIIKSSNTGIKITLSDNISISSNNILNNSNHGVNIQFSKEVIFEKNIIYNNYYGIYQISSETLILNNTIALNNFGIYVDSYSYKTVIAENLIADNKNQGLFTRNSAPVNISANEFINNIFEIYESNANKYNDYEINSNIVNNKTILVLISQKNLNFVSLNMGYMYLVNCFNISVENIKINQTFGINILSSEKIKIRNNTFEKNIQSIIAKYSLYITLENNRFLDNQKIPVFVKNTNNLRIVRNIINNSTEDGIYIYNSENFTIENNTIIKNKQNGINLTCFNDDYYENSNIIVENKIGQNKNGIQIRGYHNINIFNNTFYRNIEFGVKLETDSTSNIVYNNIFFGNNINNELSSQGYNSNPNNLWYHPSLKLGNFWNSSDQRPYLIEGAENYDLFPILENNLTDTDNDSMFDWWEKYYSLDFTKNDSYFDLDNDNLTNYFEFIYKTDPNNNDTDFDDLSDFEEIYIFMTNPNSNDSDKDKMDDSWEIKYGLNPLYDDSQQDKDEDGLNNLLEFEIKTNPNQTDSDNDGMDDYFEYIYNFDPLYNDSQLDYDGDGLVNLIEYYFKSDPTSVDTDGDGYTDKEEMEAHTDPNNPYSNISIRTKEHILFVIWWVIRSILIIMVVFFLAVKLKKRNMKNKIKDHKHNK